MAAVFAVWFGLSLLPGRKPLCLRFAERISGGIVPEGSDRYCRRLTWVWFAILLSVAAWNAYFVLVARRPVFSAVALVAVPLAFFVEKRIRDRRFRIVFHTSGSSGKSKTIVKTFENLAREVAMHRDRYRRELGAEVIGRLTVLATIDPNHMYGTLWRTMLPAALGCECDPEIILTPESLVAKMRGADRVFLVTTPSFLERFVAYADQYEVPRNCVEIVTSGAALPAAVSTRTREVFGVEPLQIYGSTETGGIAWCRGTGMAAQVFGPVRVSLREGRLLVRSPFSFRSPYLMGDAAELAPDGRSFRLLGRVDRLVKINEERVNLAEMEAKVRALGFRDCALAKLAGTHGDCLGCLLVRGDLKVSQDALALRSLLLPVFPRATVPKRIRLVRALPRNPQGKVLASEVVALLESALVEPDTEIVGEGADRLVADVIFNPSASYFQGHFPGSPILPGVVQLGLAARWAEALVGVGLKLKAVKRMKFVHVIEPAEKIRLSLVRKHGNEVDYVYSKGDAVCSQGTLLF